jgi:SNF2 family DNA or RNA helicase
VDAYWNGVANNHIGKHSTIARHIPTTQGQIERLDQAYEELSNSNAECISDLGTKEPAIRTLDYLRDRLGIVNGTLPGMNPDAGYLLWHQLQAIYWLLGKYSRSVSSEPFTLEGGLIIGDAPGLGKTLIVLGFLGWISNWHWRQALGPPRVLLQGMGSLHEPDGPIFLIVPVAIMRQWKIEADRWLQPGSFEFYLYPGHRRERPAWWAQWKGSSTLMAKRVVLVSYALLRLDYCRKFETKSADPTNGVLAQPKETQEEGPSLYDLIPWMIIVDEAHYARNMATDTFRSIHHLVSTARCCILLTATPIHNRLEDMLNLLVLGSMRTTPILGSITRHIRQQIPIYRARASQHRRKLEGYKTSGQVEVEVQIPSSEEVDGNMVEKLGFGKDFLTRMVQVMRYAIGPYYIGRSHESQDWEGHPLLRLPPKTSILRTVQLSELEREWYNSEQESAYPAPKGGKKVTSVRHVPRQ